MNSIKTIIDNILTKLKYVGLSNTFKYYYFRICKIKKLIQIKIDEKRIFIRTNSPDLNVSIASLYEEYKDFKGLTKQLLEPNLIVDAGGYIGTSALKFSEMYPNAKIVTLEPSSENYEILLLNVKNYKNIYPIKSALVSSANEKIDIRDRSTGPWGYTVVRKPLDNKNSKIIEKVSTITLSEIVKKFNMNINVLKLDIEGGEKDIFDNCQKEIKVIETIIVELHDRIIPGCRSSVEDSNKDKYIIKLDGEKFIATKSNN